MDFEPVPDNGTQWPSGTVSGLCDREVAGSTPARGCCVPTPTQRAIPPGSVNEYQQKLGSKRAYHTMHWPRIRGLAASAGVQLRANETEISAALWTLDAQERTLLTLPDYVGTGVHLYVVSSFCFHYLC